MFGIAPSYPAMRFTLACQSENAIQCVINVLGAKKFRLVDNKIDLLLKQQGWTGVIVAQGSNARANIIDTITDPELFGMASLAMVPISIVAHERQRGKTEIALVANNFADGTELFVVLIPSRRVDANSWVEYKFFAKCMNAVISSLREANLLTSPRKASSLISYLMIYQQILAIFNACVGKLKSCQTRSLFKGVCLAAN